MNHFKRSIKTVLLIIENIFYRTTMIFFKNIFLKPFAKVNGFFSFKIEKKF